MLDLPLFNFVIHNFRLAALRSIAIFHCWDSMALFSFSQMANNAILYSRFISLSNFTGNFDSDFEFRYFKVERPTVGVFLDMNCPETEWFLNLTDFHHLYNEHFHWLLYDREADFDRFRNLFEKANISINADLTYAVLQQTQLLEKSNSNASGLKIFSQYDVYNNGYFIGGKLNVTGDRSFACTVIGCQLERCLSNLHRRSKFGNRDRQSDVTFRVAVVITKFPLTAPFEEKIKFLIDENISHIDSLIRFGFRQTLIIQDMLGSNFSYIFVDRWSTTETSGGEVGALFEGRADFGTSPNAITLVRGKLFANVIETSMFHMTCIFRTPRNTGFTSSGDVFLAPFQISVWMFFGITLLLTAFLLWIVFRVEKRRMHKYLTYAPSLLTSCLLTFGTACIQGTYVMPRSVGGRIAYTALAFASFIMYNYYTSVIVAILLGDPIKSDITTLQQLAESPLDVGFEQLIHNVAFMNYSKVPAVRLLSKRKIESKKDPKSVWLALEEGVLRVRDQPGFVFVLDATTGFILVEKHYKPDEICDLNEILIRPERSLSLMVLQNSTFKELFRLRYLRLLETGINRRNLFNYLRDRLNCFSSTPVVDVGLEYTSPLFILMLLSYGFCVVVVILERVWKYYGIKKFQHLCCEMQF